MQCGAKCFVVEYEQNGEIKTMPIIARTPVQVRKVFKNEVQDDVKIVKITKKSRG